MGIWNIGPDVLARSRFTLSALAETVSALAILAGREPPYGLRTWAAAHRPAYRDLLRRDEVAALLVDAVFRPTWIAGFVVTPPQRGDTTFEDEIGRVRETPAKVALADLARSLGGPVPARLAVPDVAERAADLIEWVWTRTVRPYWPRRRRVLEADVVARTQQLSREGWAGALAGMRPGMSWLGDGRLRINAYDNPPRDLAAGAELMYVPTTAGGWVSWAEPHRYAVVYPCSGLLADAGHRAPPPRSLRRLLGPLRATVLLLLETPKSTSQLVGLTGASLGSVGGHLRVLLDAGLVRRRRAGRSVLYYRTGTGDRLVELQRDAPAT